MKFFSETRRAVPNVRKKYGTPEKKKEALIRLKKEREVRERKSLMKKEIREKNKDEFHFSFHTLNKNMIKKTDLDEDQLKKTLRYAESEIARCKRILEMSMKPSAGRHVKFSDGENHDVTVKSESPKQNEYEEYILELIEKTKEINTKINQLLNKRRR